MSKFIEESELENVEGFFKKFFEVDDVRLVSNEEIALRWDTYEHRLVPTDGCVISETMNPVKVCDKIRDAYLSTLNIQ